MLWVVRTTEQTWVYMGLSDHITHQNPLYQLLLIPYRCAKNTTFQSITPCSQRLER